MPHRQSSFGLALSNVPAVNLRLDFNTLLGLFRNETFRRKFQGHQGVVDEIRTPHFTWYGRPNVLLTHLLREAIVGLESAVSSAVAFEAPERGVPQDVYRRAVDNPFSLGNGTAHCVYNLLPSVLDPGYALRLRNPTLWLRIKDFYREVRNGLFHSFEIADCDPEPVWHCLELLREVHEWLNGWHPIEQIARGPTHWNPTTLERLESPLEISETEVLRRSPSRTLPAEFGVRAEDVPEGMLVVHVEDVTGIYVPPSELVDISVLCDDGTKGKFNLSVCAAMRLLVFLARAQNARGWAIPERL